MFTALTFTCRYAAWTKIQNNSKIPPHGYSETLFVVILTCVYLGVLTWCIMLERHCGRAAEKEWIEVLLCLCIKVRYCKTGKNSVWAMECGNTTQSAAINEGMQGWAGSGAETAAQIILWDKGTGVSYELNSPLTANTNRSSCLLAWNLICHFYARHIP